jgi:protein gp37
MSLNSYIEWTDATWNPVRGCTKISPGCTHCYAETFAERFRGVPGHPYEHGFDLRLVPEKLPEPLHWRRPRMIFVNSMSDLFHEDVPDEWIDKVFAVMALCPQHTFQMLTKRAERMRNYMFRKDERGRHCGMTYAALIAATRRHDTPPLDLRTWPLPNVWLGVSAEDQTRADERIPHLLETPAAVRFVSAEPLLGPIDLETIAHGGNLINALSPAIGMPRDGHDSHIWFSREPGTILDWIIVGGESGNGARPMHPDWARSIRDQCQAAGVPFFFKQWGQWHADALLYTDTQGRNPPPWMKIGKRAAGCLLDGREWNEMPERA